MDWKMIKISIKEVLYSQKKAPFGALTIYQYPIIFRGIVCISFRFRRGRDRCGRSLVLL